MITSQVQSKAILNIVVMLLLMFTASFAFAVSGGRPLPGTGCSSSGEMLSYLPPPYMGTITVKWYNECGSGDEVFYECVFMDGNVAQLGNSGCHASFSDYFLWAQQDPNDFMHFHPGDIKGLCEKDLKNEFPCHYYAVEVPAKGFVLVGGIELISVGNIQYIENTTTYKAFTASAIMMAVTKDPK